MVMIVSYDIDRDVDLKDSLSLGTYNNRSIFFDIYSMNYKVVNFDIGEQKSKSTQQVKRFCTRTRWRDFTQSPLDCSVMFWMLDYPQEYYI